MYKDRLNLRCALIAGMLTMAMFFNSCQAIGEIFKLGVWTGIIAVALVVGIIIWIISSFSGRR